MAKGKTTNKAKAEVGSRKAEGKKAAAPAPDLVSDPFAPGSGPADVETPPGVDETTPPSGETEGSESETAPPSEGGDAGAAEPPAKRGKGKGKKAAQADDEPMPEVPESERIEDEIRSIDDQLKELGNPDQKRQALAKAHLDAVHERSAALSKLDLKVSQAHDALRKYNYDQAVPAEAAITRLSARREELTRRLATLA